MLTLVINPTAGGGYAKKVAEKVCSTLEARGIDYRECLTKASGDATILAKQAVESGDCHTVIAIGGDGTVFETAAGLVGTGMPMGIIPAGTGNDFIKSVRLPREPIAALDFILSHEPRPVDAAQINDRCFLNVCGTGFDVTVLDEAYAFSSRVRGMLPYLYGVIRAIFHYQPVHVRYDIDGRTAAKDVLIFSVANGQYFGGGIHICPQARPDDGLLDVVMVENVPRWRIPFYLPGLLSGKILKFGITTHMRCERVKVSAKGMRMQIDGEILPMDEAELTVCPNMVMLYW